MLFYLFHYCTKSKLEASFGQSSLRFTCVNYLSFAFTQLAIFRVDSLSTDVNCYQEADTSCSDNHFLWDMQNYYVCGKFVLKHVKDNECKFK